MKRVLFYSIVLFGLFIPAAQAAEAQRPGQRALERLPSHVSHSTRITDAKGRSATRDVEVQRSAGSLTRDVTVTGPEGKSRSLNQQVEITRTENGYMRESQTQGAEGKTRRANAEVVVDKDAGTVTKEVNIERANGEQASRTAVRTYNKETATSQ